MEDLADFAWVTGYSNCAKAHQLSIPVRQTDMDTVGPWMPVLCRSEPPRGWNAFWKRQPDPRLYPPCHTCLRLGGGKRRPKRERSKPGATRPHRWWR